ncbi:hypothetical protein L7F22_058654 [Adiantum nelumboides]|nr:hypothetical protein [Adiantum nelumboides]
MKQFLASDAKDKVLTKWRNLKLSPYESIHKYVNKFWDLHLKPTVYKKIDFEEQKQQFCVGLPEDMNEYVNSQRPRSISTVIHHTMVASKINFQQGAKRNLKPMESKDKQEYKGKNPSQNSSKSNSNNNKAKEKGVFKDDVPGELPPKRGDDDHMIELIPGSSPPNKPPYTVLQAQQEEIMRQVNELVEKGMVRPSSSPFCSPVLLVQKKDRTYREVENVAGLAARIVAIKVVFFTAEQARWDVKDAKSHALLALFVKQTPSPHIYSAKFGKQPWDFLASFYASCNEAKIALLRKELKSKIMNEKDAMDTFLAGVKDINEQIIFAGEVILDYFVVQIVLDALPDSYQTFASTCRLMNQRNPEVVKFDELCTLLLQESLSKINKLDNVQLNRPLLLLKEKPTSFPSHIVMTNYTLQSDMVGLLVRSTEADEGSKRVPLQTMNPNLEDPISTVIRDYERQKKRKQREKIKLKQVQVPELAFEEEKKKKILSEIVALFKRRTEGISTEDKQETWNLVSHHPLVQAVCPEESTIQSAIVCNVCNTLALVKQPSSNEELYLKHTTLSMMLNSKGNMHMSKVSRILKVPRRSLYKAKLWVTSNADGGIFSLAACQKTCLS